MWVERINFFFGIMSLSEDILFVFLENQEIRISPDNLKLSWCNQKFFFFKKQFLF